MEKIVERGLLHDSYGELLTRHQRKVYEDVVLSDLSFGEIAGELGINHQGVHNLIKRRDKILEGYEAKLHLVVKLMKIQDMAREVEHLADKCARTGDVTLIGWTHRLSGEATGTL